MFFIQPRIWAQPRCDGPCRDFVGAGVESPQPVLVPPTSSGTDYLYCKLFVPLAEGGGGEKIFGPQEIPKRVHLVSNGI